MSRARLCWLVCLDLFCLPGWVRSGLSWTIEAQMALPPLFLQCLRRICHHRRQRVHGALWGTPWARALRTAVSSLLHHLWRACWFLGISRKVRRSLHLTVHPQANQHSCSHCWNFSNLLVWGYRLHWVRHSQCVALALQGSQICRWRTSLCPSALSTPSSLASSARCRSANDWWWYCLWCWKW